MAFTHKDAKENIARFAHLKKQEPLLSKEQEFALSKAIHVKRSELWAEIFNYYPWLQGIVSLVEERFKDKLEEDQFFNLVETSRAYMRRELAKHRFAFEKAKFEAAVLMEDLDADNALAMEILEKLESGYTFGPKPREGTKPFPDWIANIKLHLSALKKLKETFFKRNIFLALSITMKFSWADVDHEDIAQEAFKGLMKGIERFDHRKGFKFTTYGSWWIRHAISRFIANNSNTVRIPVHMHTLATQFKKLEAELSAKGIEYDDEVIAKRLGIPMKKLEKLYVHLASYQVSFDEPHPGMDEKVSLLERVEDPDHRADSEHDELDEKEFIARHIVRLTPREQFIIKHRFGFVPDQETKTLASIGEEYGISRERIRQIEAASLKVLRDRMNRELSK
jgi:RNA polymerase primary sigma factor